MSAAAPKPPPDGRHSGDDLATYCREATRCASINSDPPLLATRRAYLAARASYVRELEAAGASAEYVEALLRGEREGGG